MSTSPRQSRSILPTDCPPNELQPFPYDSISLDSHPYSTTPEAFSTSHSATAPDDSALRQARAAGKEEGMSEARKRFEDQLQKEKTALTTALQEFNRDRAEYFRKVEAEVVQLALGIARKILHRESQVDPLLLAGIVRFALERIDGATEVTLRVHPSHSEKWKSYFLQFKTEASPTIVEDPGLEADKCILQTTMGSAVLGIEPQLKEIEKGLLELMAARPGAKS